MKVKKVVAGIEPDYPCQRQFKLYGTAVVGAAAIGLTSMTSGCKEPFRTGGVVAMDTQRTNSVKPSDSRTSPDPEGVRLRGDMAVEPKPVLKGTPPVEPLPVLGGEMPVEPSVKLLGEPPVEPKPGPVGKIPAAR